MKNKIAKIAVSLLALAFVHTAAFGEEKDSDSSSPKSAIMCDKCTTVWIKAVDKNAKGTVIGLSKDKKMACKDCTSAAETFFTTGKLKHECATCGGAMSHCEAH